MNKERIYLITCNTKREKRNLLPAKLRRLFTNDIKRTLFMNYPLYSDEFFMNEALKEARKAFDKDEVPIGAVIVAGNIIIARGHNMTENLSDVTAHAEMLAITSAENYLGSKYLNDCTLFVTLEPCLMCASATQWAQIGRIVTGASDPRAGYSLVNGNVLHPRTVLQKGVLNDECSQLMRDFFQLKRKKSKGSQLL